MVTVGVIGAGPAGIMAALAAARGGASVLLFDGNKVVGRKLMATGNGRGNLSNANAAPERYACADTGFLEALFHRYPPPRLHADLLDAGILTYRTADGWYYPVSNSAPAVAAILAAALVEAGVAVHLESTITGIRTAPGDASRPRFLLARGDGAPVTVDRVVVAGGGVAHPALGSRGQCFPLLERLGHAIVMPRPALAPIVADVRRFHKLQGVRLDARLTLMDGDRRLGETVGNMMFTQTGFSGPAPMDLSHLVGGGDRPLRLALDLLPHHEPELRRLLAARRGRALPLAVALCAVLPPKVPPVYLRLAGLDADAGLDRLSQSDVERVLALLTGTTVDVTGSGGFEVAQLSSGGVPVTEVDPETMQSRLVPGLHLAGEVLDVVGPCGGYNLHFAFSSGAVAGAAAAPARR